MPSVQTFAHRAIRGSCWGGGLSWGMWAGKGSGGSMTENGGEMAENVGKCRWSDCQFSGFAGFGSWIGSGESGRGGGATLWVGGRRNGHISRNVGMPNLTPLAGGKGLQFAYMSVTKWEFWNNWDRKCGFRNNWRAIRGLKNKSWGFCAFANKLCTKCEFWNKSGRK